MTHDECSTKTIKKNCHEYCPLCERFVWLYECNGNSKNNPRGFAYGGNDGKISFNPNGKNIIGIAQ